MLNHLDDQLLDDVVSRAEQSRFSYTMQTEEFRNLNSNLQTYLNDIQRVDDENHQLQENIEQIRTDYIITLENHLKRLPNDFREESSKLTEAHIERYKFKSRGKRHLNEREELKKRINFLVYYEKDQIKRLNNLQKQERLTATEFQNLNEQLQNLYNHVQLEKQTHRQSMDKIDNLQLELEQICIERSKTEFQIQTLREQVKLMQTTKEFLDEEHQNILSTQIEANEYLLSRLNDSVARIREDFNQLNKLQLKQLENEYKQMITVLEEDSLANQTHNETIMNQQRTFQNEYKNLQDEYESVTQELTTLDEHNQVLAETVVHMEKDLYTMRNQRVKELTVKDNEFETNQLELEFLNEKLSHLAEYDRNLKFELTLYRGVLESEYRRKEQQIKNNQQPTRPNILRTTTKRSNKHPPILTNRNQQEAFVEKNNTQLGHENIENKEDLNDQQKYKTIEEQHQTISETSKSPISMVPVDQSSATKLRTNQEQTSDNNAQLTDLADSLDEQQISLETAKLSTSPTDAIALEDQAVSADNLQSAITSSDIENLPEVTPTNEEEELIDAPPISTKDNKMSTNNQKSLPPSPDLEISSAEQESSINPSVSENQLDSSEVNQTPSTELGDQRTVSEVHQSSLTEADDQRRASEILQSPPIELQGQSLASELHQSSLTELEPQVESAEVPQSSSTKGEDQLKSPSFLLGNHPMSSEPQESSSTEPGDHQQASETPQISSTEFQEQSESSEVSESSSIKPGDQQGPSKSPQLSATSSKDEQKPLKSEEQSLTSSSILPDIQQIGSDEQPSSNEQTVVLDSSNIPSERNPSISSDTQQSTTNNENVQEEPPSLTRDNQQILSSDNTITNPLSPSSSDKKGFGEKQLTTASDEYDNLDEHNVEIDDAKNDHSEATLQGDETYQKEAFSSDFSIPSYEQTKQTVDSSENKPFTSEEETKNNTGYISSTGYYGTVNDYIHTINQEQTQPLSSATSVSDVVGEANPTMSPKLEDTDFDDNNSTESNLELVMQDLRYVYRNLINDDYLIEINNDFPNNLIDSLEFGDNLIRILFENFLRKYLVGPANTELRSHTLDWNEFRDILFPIITSRYTKGHIRKLFSLFDINKNGYLSSIEINELLELLQINNPDQIEGDMNVDKLIETIEQIDQVNNHILPEDIETKDWYIQSPSDEENNGIQSISLEVPTGNYSSKINNGMILLGRIFKRLGADFENKQLDITKPTLLMQLTNEFIHNNIPISSSYLQSFIELYLNKKQHTDSFITWTEFRDIFSPLVNGGLISKDGIKRWFDLLDANNNQTISEEEVRHFLQLLQIPNSKEILDKISELFPFNDHSLKFEELIFALKGLDETNIHLLPTNEQINSFDLSWFTKNIF